MKLISGGKVNAKQGEFPEKPPVFEDAVADGLTFQIHPEGETTSLDLFVRTLEDVRKLLIEVDYAVNRQRSGKRWVVAQLHSSAPTFTIASAGMDLKEPIDAMIGGISEISHGTDVPPQYFTEDALQRLSKMSRHFRGPDKARSILVSSNGHKTAIAEDIGDKVKRVLSSGYSSLGALEGHLDAVNLHRKPNFTMWERVSRAPVSCSFPNDGEWKECVKALLEKRIIVRGRIRYFSNGVPRSVSGIAEILDNTPDPALTRAEFGSIPDEEAAKDPAKFLRVIRGYGED